jgi:hypothetical protein
MSYVELPATEAQRGSAVTGQAQQFQIRPRAITADEFYANLPELSEPQSSRLSVAEDLPCIGKADRQVWRLAVPEQLTDKHPRYRRRKVRAQHNLILVLWRQLIRIARRLTEAIRREKRWLRNLSDYQVVEELVTNALLVVEIDILDGRDPHMVVSIPLEHFEQLTLYPTP